MGKEAAGWLCCRRTELWMFQHSIKINTLIDLEDLTVNKINAPIDSDNML